MTEKKKQTSSVEAKTVLVSEELTPMDLGELMEEIAPAGKKMKPEDIVGKEFVLTRARSFYSKYEEQDHAYHVVGTFVKGGELFNTVIGGAQPVEVLDVLSTKTPLPPIKMTLKYNEGGRFDGFYTLE